MIGTKMLKSEFNQEEYIKLVTWCNDHDYKTIADKGDYYEVIDCTPTQEELNEIEKSKLLQQLEQVNTKIQEVVAASMYVSNDTTDIVIDGELVQMSVAQLDQYRTTIMNERANILQKIKELK